MDGISRAFVPPWSTGGSNASRYFVSRSRPRVATRCGRNPRHASLVRVVYQNTLDLFRRPARFVNNSLRAPTVLDNLRPRPTRFLAGAGHVLPGRAASYPAGDKTTRGEST